MYEYDYFLKMSFSRTAVLVGYFLLVFHGAFVVGQRNNEDLQSRLSTSPDLSEFYDMIERNKLATAMLENAPMTIFAPTNEAFQKLKNKSLKDDYLLFYHMCNIPYKLDDLPGTGGSINTVATGNPPLWLTRTSSNQVYINNARINPDLSFSTDTPVTSKRKALHIISEVLQPLRMKDNDVTKLNPNAWGLLEKSEEFQLTHRTSVFYSSVKTWQKENLFRDRGPNTYLIPIDDGLVKKSTSNAIDSKVIDAHVIPDKVLFLNPTPEYEIYRPTAFTDLVKVTVSFPWDRSTGKRYVRSDTLVGDRNHSSGVVLSEIVSANIPVSNGVVHLIKNPLMVIDKTIQQFIDENVDGPISIFKQKLQYAGAVFRSKLSQNGGFTLFIPSNAAWKNENVEKAVSNVTLLENILNLHLVNEKVTVNNMLERGSKEVNSLNPGKKLYFNVIVQGTNRTMTVEGGGVNATVLHADVAAINGVIHIIDRVLGIPYATVGRKVATDPMLNMTHTLGKYQNFNNRLDDMTQNYTFFAPRDVAWEYLKIAQPSLYNDLMIPVNAYSVLERHLVVSGNFTMAELKRIANSSYVLPAANGALTIRVKEDENKGYSIKWNDDEWVAVYKADVRCTNGIIHLIDRVLITPNDITVHVGGALRIDHKFTILLTAVLLPLYTLFNYHLSSPIF